MDDEQRRRHIMDVVSFERNTGKVKKGVLVVFSRAIKAKVKCVFRGDQDHHTIQQMAIGSHITQTMEIKLCYERVAFLEAEVARLKKELEKERIANVATRRKLKKT